MDDRQKKRVTLLVAKPILVEDIRALLIGLTTG